MVPCASFSLSSEKHKRLATHNKANFSARTASTFISKLPIPSMPSSGVIHKHQHVISQQQQSLKLKKREKQSIPQFQNTHRLRLTPLLPHPTGDPAESFKSYGFEQTEQKATVSIPTSAMASTTIISARFGQSSDCYLRNHSNHIPSQQEPSWTLPDMKEKWVKVTEDAAKEFEEEKALRINKTQRTAQSRYDITEPYLNEDTTLSDESQPDAMNSIDLWSEDDGNQQPSVVSLQKLVSDNMLEDYLVTPSSLVPCDDDL
ncbi:MAG: hypothetical protein BYD32DRAFT_459146 [Podila humilis]|nr:MAG: hypothetical protein BYD32DRAFT_459146 [Podila humilis]